MLGDQGTLYALFIYFFRYLIDFSRKKKQLSQIYLDWKNTLDRSWKNSYSKQIIPPPPRQQLVSIFFSNPFFFPFLFALPNELSPWNEAEGDGERKH